MHAVTTKKEEPTASRRESTGRFLAQQVRDATTCDKSPRVCRASGSAGSEIKCGLEHMWAELVCGLWAVSENGQCGGIIQPWGTSANCSTRAVALQRQVPTQLDGEPRRGQEVDGLNFKSVKMMSIDHEPARFLETHRKLIMMVGILSWHLICGKVPLSANYVMNALATLHNVSYKEKKRKESTEMKYKSGTRVPKVCYSFEGMVLSEAFQVAAIMRSASRMEGLENYLKQAKGNERRRVNCRLELKTNALEKRFSSQAEVKANMVEHGQSSKSKKKPSKGYHFGPKGGIFKKQKFQGKCFNCDKMGHKAAE
ncbi:hypothetical protein FNV43_RR07846 [Rhamnella rubrinervis]|uniref:CCHC-type domain-containing protein n=1 Tax=Rhamnella rubrinervis TaxID=2594499 RepID=A0A8K0HG42_9ROSA|nr:hypothetical protein FNV43_RR07846 [Rhamnella rubrinervis]